MFGVRILNVYSTLDYESRLWPGRRDAFRYDPPVANLSMAMFLCLWGDRLESTVDRG